MSMSVSASNNALAYLQQLLQSGSGGVGATSTDPLLTLGQTLTWSGRREPTAIGHIADGVWLRANFRIWHFGGAHFVARSVGERCGGAIPVGLILTAGHRW